MDRVFFIDLNGKIIENKEYASHVGLAKYIIANNELLKEQYNASGCEREDLFLLNNLGYIHGSSSEYNRLLIINKEKATKEQKGTAFGLVQSGYEYYFTSDEQIKARY